MNTTHIRTKFEQLGVRAKFRPPAPRRWQEPTGPVVIDIGRDRHGEFFDIQAEADARVEVLDVQPRDRHLLLMVRQTPDRPGLTDIKDKFLCGHDERHWFVAGIPERAPVGTVIAAKQSLKPAVVVDLERCKKSRRAKRKGRKTDTFIRQGEWFFLPSPDVTPGDALLFRNEPLRRGRGKPHLCEQLFRTGGTTVYVCRKYPNGLTSENYRQCLARNPGADKWKWQVMQRDPTAFVRGAVSHADHATIHLPCWHRVAMNTENQSRAMAAVAFLD